MSRLPICLAKAGRKAEISARLEAGQGVFAHTCEERAQCAGRAFTTYHNNVKLGDEGLEPPTSAV